MGCVYSQRHKSGENSSQDSARVFHVCNVDERGTEVNFGKIEITDNELALHQKGRNSIYWSLRSLRRYGFDAQLFSFECGRRCPTGPGIYAFKCTNAEQLFNALQEAIQQCTSSALPLFAASNPTADNSPPEVGPRYPLRQSAPHLYSNDIHEYTNSPFYVNTANTAQTAANSGLKTNARENQNYAKLDDLVRFYVNIAPQQTQPHNEDNPDAAEPVNYIMLDLDQSCPPSSGGTPTVVTTAPPTPVSKTPTMEYPPSATPPTTPTASSPPQPYAQIDFAKTVALSTSAANHRKM